MVRRAGTDEVRWPTRAPRSRSSPVPSRPVRDSGPGRGPVQVPGDSHRVPHDSGRDPRLASSVLHGAVSRRGADTAAAEMIWPGGSGGFLRPDLTYFTAARAVGGVPGPQVWPVLSTRTRSRGVVCRPGRSVVCPVAPRSRPGWGVTQVPGKGPSGSRRDRTVRLMTTAGPGRSVLVSARHGITARRATWPAGPERSHGGAPPGRAGQLTVDVVGGVHARSRRHRSGIVTISSSSRWGRRRNRPRSIELTATRSDCRNHG